MSQWFVIQHQDLSHQLISRYLSGLTLISPFRPTPRGSFDVKTLYFISRAFHIIFYSHFLGSILCILRMSNIAPHSKAGFVPRKQFLRQDLVFRTSGAHIVVKWTKTLQNLKAHHIVQLPTIDKMYLCPIMNYCIYLGFYVVFNTVQVIS